MPETRLKTVEAKGVYFPLFYQARGSCPLGGLTLYKLLPKTAKIDGDARKGGRNWKQFKTEKLAQINPIRQ
ncbi:hypothetical protein [Moorena sp. SIO3H5]|uniref:hypothetical protein n=1 Tax=Moorena sp. SIO3H5 TaxID=2607834 RepID=UPI0013BDFAA8|nr:hypothetical protein [Moorena sp. SIO3H5]NEO70267.1 hypothetical protein [Moorena sp. SIO3H5]